MKLPKTFITYSIFLLTVLNQSFFSIVYAQVPTLEWVSGGQAGHHHVTDIVTTNDHAYITGYSLSGALSIEDTVLRSSVYGQFGVPYSFPYLIHYDTNGYFIDVLMGQVSAPTYGNQLATDATGNIYWGGIMFDDLVLGPDTLRTPAKALFLVKYNAAGATSWTTTDIQGDIDGLSGLVVDETGNVYLTGSVYGNLIVGDTTLIGGAGIHNSDSFIIKLNATGQLIWAKLLKGSDGDFPKDLVLDQAGHLYVVGGYSGASFVVDSDTLRDDFYGQVLGNFYIVKLDTARGGVLQMLSGVGNGKEVANAVAVDEQENIYALLEYNGSFLTLGDTTLHYNQNTLSDGCLVKYNKFGVLLWVKAIQGDIQFDLRNLELTNSGLLYCSGFFQGPSLTIDHLQLDNHPTYFEDTTSAPRDGFIAQFSVDGTIHSLTPVSGAGYETVDAMLVQDNQLYIAGSSGNDDLFGAYQYNLYLAKLSTVVAVNETYQQHQPNLKIYPNPSQSGFFTIPSIGKSIKQLTVYQAQGQIVHVVPSNAISLTFSYMLDLHHLSDGYYWVQIIWEDGQQGSYLINK